MCTASHNPKAYTGAKLVREGAIALSGDAGIQDVRRAIEAGLGEAVGAAAAASRRSRSTPTSTPTRCASSTPSAVKPLRVVVDGGNGMAGPMVGPLLERLGLDLVTAYWTPDGEFPDHEPNPLLPENREFIMRKVVEERADLGIAWDGDADRCFFIDDRGRFVDGDFLTALLAESLLRKTPARRSSTTCAPAAPSPTPSSGRRQRAPQPRRARVLQDAHARRGRDVRRRGLRPLLLPRLLLRRQRHDPGAADPRAAQRRGAQAVGAAGPLPRDVLHLRRDQLDRRRRAGEARRDRGALRRRADRPSRRRLGRLRRLALQRAHVEHRAAHAPVPGVAGLRRRTWSAAATRCWPSSAHDCASDETDAAAALARAAAAGIHCLPIPTPFQVGRVNTYLIEDDPLTLVDSGPNSGTALDALERALADARPPRRGPRADRHLPPAHRPPRARVDPRAPLRARGRGAGPARAARRALEGGHGRRRRLRRARHGRARHPAGRALRAARPSRRATAAGARRRR